MEDIKLTLEAIRVQMGVTRKEMADKLGINIDRYNRLACGESKMLADEFIRISEVSGISMKNIATK